MVLRTGIDIICVPSLSTKLDQPGFKELAFHPSELENEDPAHLAGILAAKEAFFKAINHPVEWLHVEVKYEGTGRPMLSFSDSLTQDFSDCDLSIAHDGEYAIAQVILDWKGEL